MQLLLCVLVLFIYLFLWLHPQHMEVPGLGTESRLQLWPMPQLQQCQIFNSLHMAWGLNSCLHSDSSCCSWILNPLHQMSFLFFSLFFLGLHLWHVEVPKARGWIGVVATSLCHSQGFQAVSATYTSARGNIWTLTHWARPGIEPASSWILVGFITPWDATGTLKCSFL